ncbi:MAG: DoxX family protein [bacterium]
METGIDKKLEELFYKGVSLYLGIDFILAGLSNFSTDYDFDTRFGYPAWIQIPIGIAETLAGFGLFFRRTNIASLLVLTVVMTGAMFSHLRAQDGGYGTPLKYLLYFAIMLFYKRGEIKKSLKLSS